MPEPTVEAPDKAAERSRGPSALAKFLPIILVALISSAGGGVLSAFLISRTLAVEANDTKPADQAEADEIAEILEKGGVLDLEPFVVNLADTEAARYLRIRISLMLDDKAYIPEAQENAALQFKVRDVILQTLTSKTSAELIDDEGKNRLREEIRSRIEAYFRQPKLVDVMFTEFVIQL